MPQGPLHHEQVIGRAVEVGGEGMPQPVRRQFLFDPGLPQPVGEPVGNLPLAESAVPVRQEQGFHFRAAVSTTLGQVTAQQCAEVGLDELDLRHIPLGPHPQMLGVEVDVIHVERGQLAKPDPRAQQHLDHGAVAQRGEIGPPLELLEQTFLFGGSQEDRQLSRQPMHADGPGRVVTDHARLGGPGEKGPHRRLHPMERGRRAWASLTLGDRPGGKHLVEEPDRDLPADDPRGQLPGHAGHQGEVPAVCGYGRRGTSFGRQAGTERLCRARQIEVSCSVAHRWTPSPGCDPWACSWAAAAPRCAPTPWPRPSSCGTPGRSWQWCARPAPCRQGD